MQTRSGSLCFEVVGISSVPLTSFSTLLIRASSFSLTGVLSVLACTYPTDQHKMTSVPNNTKLYTVILKSQHTSKQGCKTEYLTIQSE